MPVAEETNFLSYSVFLMKGERCGVAAPRITAPHYSSRTRKPRTYESYSPSGPFLPTIAVTSATEYELNNQFVQQRDRVVFVALFFIGKY